jgi:predicted dehydrogenase
MFWEAMRHFISRIQNGGEPAVSLADSIQVLKIALAARHSSIDKMSVAPDTLCD